MTIAKSNEYISNLVSFASVYTAGGTIFVEKNSENECTALVAPPGSSVFTKLNNQICYSELVSFCEFDSERFK